ncbi:type II secretion system secretin GspD [Bdellovibrio sp. HCB337]|uniref:type II secretion system secretin GspD n=1 Tax=Bdellovibrio sp. HCB337 TaxID=3394358 RepID=UPI0039A53A55
MKMKVKNRQKTALGIASLLTTQIAMAQSFPPPPPMPSAADFPPPPPSISDSGSGSSGVRGAGPGGADSGKPGALSKSQQGKFAKAGLEDITNENFPETIESFDFPNVEITDVIKAISELTGKNFIIDPGVRGKITIVAPSKITVAEAYKAFLSALAINGFTVVPSGSFLKIKSARYAQRDNIETYSGSYYPNSDQMITRIIHLKHIQAEQVNRDLRILTSKDGEMSVYTATNSLILSDYGSNIDRVMKIIGQLDVPGFEDQIEVIPIKYAKAKDLADLVDKIVNKGQKSAGTSPGSFSAGVPRFTRSQGTTAQQGTSFFMAIPEDRTNSIIAMGNKSGIVRLKKLIAQLDFRVRAGDNGGVYVYYVKNGDAEKIAQTLQGITKDAAPKPASSLLGPLGGNPTAQQTTEIFGGDVKITADKSTNSIVITASKQDYEAVLNILNKLDIARDQVFVETIIMEMANSDANNWGVGYYQFNEGVGKAGFVSNGFDFASLLSPIGGTGATLGFGQGKNVTVTDPTKPGTSITIPSLVGFINFIKSNTKANILSTPQVLALDNQTAEIEVGDKVPVSITQTTNAAGQITNSAQFEEATIKLTIKPFISPSSDTIRMEVDQKIKQLTQVAALPKNLSDNSQPLATRNIKTTLVIKNEDTAVLGGLIRDRESETISKVPLLGDLPIIGWLFKGRSTTKEKVNLLVFLTPKIIRNPTDQKTILNRKLDERLQFIKAQGGRDPYGSTIDRVGKKTSQPVDDNASE